jgi:Tol biopolymer transport system component
MSVLERYTDQDCAILLHCSRLDVRILATSTREQYDPIISPNGRRIVFRSNRSGSDEIWVCDSDGSNAQQLTSFGGALTGTPRWSPDSKQIVFDSRAGGEANVYVIDANGGGAKKVETGTRMNSLPSWSHDGNWIYFATGLTHSKLTLWRVAATGGRAVQLTKTASIMPLESPDGQYVYFVRFTEEKFRLWRVRPDGSGESMLKAMPPRIQTATNGGLLNPAFTFTRTKTVTRSLISLICLPRVFVASALSINLQPLGLAGFQFHQTASGFCIHGSMTRPAI